MLAVGLAVRGCVNENAKAGQGTGPATGASPAPSPKAPPDTLQLTDVIGSIPQKQNSRLYFEKNGVVVRVFYDRSGQITAWWIYNNGLSGTFSVHFPGRLNPNSLIEPDGEPAAGKGGSRPPPPPAGAAGSAGTVGVTSDDPNSLIGPAGYGTSNFVAAGTLLPYEIEFENDPSATGPAQRVDITDQLSPNLNWSTLQLTSVGFGSTRILIPAGLQHYTTSVNITENGQVFEVIVALNLNVATGLFTASFQTIDPTTGLPPANLLAGFLPPGR